MNPFGERACLPRALFASRVNRAFAYILEGGEWMFYLNGHSSGTHLAEILARVKG